MHPPAPLPQPARAPGGAPPGQPASMVNFSAMAGDVFPAAQAQHAGSATAPGGYMPPY